MASAPLCAKCVHCVEDAIFVLCTRAESVYKGARDDEYHTTDHMRLYECGESAVLFSPAPRSK